MSEQVMQDPPRENIDGEKIVHHRFDHGIDWSVNVSHVLIALAALAVLVYLARRSDDRDDEDATAGGVGV